MKIQDMTQNEKNDLLTTLWDDPSVTLQGVKDDTVSSIDRDQAVDEYGVAQYGSYEFLLPYETDDDVFEFTAEDVEAFARTW